MDGGIGPELVNPCTGYRVIKKMVRLRPAALFSFRENPSTVDNRIPIKCLVKHIYQTNNPVSNLVLQRDESLA